MVKLGARWCGCLCAVLLGCGSDFRPETLVENLRVLGVRSTPAELRPGEVGRLEALVLDPSRPGKPIGVLWVACEPDPFNQNRGACSDVSVLKDTSQLAAGLPAGMRVIGLGPSATYAVPSTLFDVFPAGDERRLVGTVAQVLLIAVAEQISPTASRAELEAVFERVRKQEVRSVVTLFRIKVSEDPERNANPELAQLVVAGEALAEDAHVQVLPQERVAMDLGVTESSWQSFVSRTPQGPVSTTERLLAAWYSTAGRFSEDRTALEEAVKTVFTAPGGAGDPLPPRAEGRFFVVLRDTRGGQSWKDFPFHVCNDARSAPHITAVRAPTRGTVEVEGEWLESILDVVVEGRAYRGAPSPSRGTWEGTLGRPLAPGEYPITVFTRACRRIPLGPLRVE